MLTRRSAVSTNEEALRQLTTANGLIRRGRSHEAERIFRQILQKHSGGLTEGDLQAQADALVGLSDASVTASRQRAKEPVEQFWFLVRALCFLRRAKEVLKPQTDRQGKTSLAYEGLQSKTRTVHNEAYNLLRQTLMGRKPRDDVFGRHRNSYRIRSNEEKENVEAEDMTLSSEERGRQFLENFFNFCASKERRIALLREPDRRVLNLDAISYRRKAPVQRPRISSSMMNLSTPSTTEQNYTVQEADETVVTSANIREEVEDTVRLLKQRLGIPATPRQPNVDPTGDLAYDLSSMMRNHRRRMAFLASEEAHHVIEYEAENIVEGLKLRRGTSTDRLNTLSPTNQNIRGLDMSENQNLGTRVGGSRMRRSTSLMDTSSAGLAKSSSHASLTNLAEEPVTITDGVNRRRGDSSSLILRRRLLRRQQRSRDALTGTLSMSCLDLSDVGKQSPFDSPAARYRQMRLERSAVGLEPCFVEELKEEEETEEAEEESARELEEEPPEEPSITQLHAEWIHTLVHFANRLDLEDDMDGAACVLGHTLFLYEMLERDVVELDVMAFVMRRLGVIRCHKGNLSGGISLMERALSVYCDLPNSEPLMMEQAAVWFEMGNAYLRGVRGLDLARRAISVAVRKHINQETMRPEDQLLGNGEAVEFPTQVTSVHADDDDIASNARQALSSYKRCLAMMEFVPNHVQPKEFRERLLTRLGDCYLILGDSDTANEYYETAQGKFADSTAQGTLEENAHVLCMLGVGRFLNGNYSKALAVLEAAYVILYHQSMNENARKAGDVSRDTRYFITALLALCYARTEHNYKTLNWCTRSLGFFRTQFGISYSGLTEENDAWLLCQVLLVYGKALSFFARHQEAVSSYRKAITLVDDKLGGDVYLKCSLLKVIGDNYNARGLQEEALGLYQQAVEVIESYDDPENFGVSFQKAKLFSTLGHTLVDLQRRSEASNYLRRSASLQFSIQDELTGSVVALQYQMAIRALHECDHDKAFELLTDALRMYSEEHGRLGTDTAPILAHLASIYHMRSLTNDSSELSMQGDARFREAMCLDDSPGLALKYAFFLWDRRRLEDAMDRLESVLKRLDLSTHLVSYEHYEELIVPQPLDREMLAGEAVDFPAESFALFVLLMVYREAGWGSLMDTVTLWLWKLAEQVDYAMNWSILGYAFMEYQMFEEAASAFAHAAYLQEFQNEITIENFVINLFIIFAQAVRFQELATKVLAVGTK